MTVFTLVSLVGLSVPGWWTLVAAGLSVVVGVLYVAHKRGTEPPVLRVRHVIDRPYRLLHLTAVFTIASGIGSNTFLTLWVKGVRGFSTGEAAFTVIFLTVGWTTGAFISSRVVERRTEAHAILAGTAVLAVSVTAAAAAIVTLAPVWMALAAFTGVGLGMGSVSSAGVTLLQAHARPAEMGRLMSAHQFIRTLGFSYGAALSGSVLFGVVVRRLGDAEAVRSLLGDDVAITDPATVDALQDGFATSTVLMAVLSWGAFWFGLRLWRHGDSTEIPAPADAVPS
jgi:predicted MFS family arabinose efflux permease